MVADPIRRGNTGDNTPAVLTVRLDVYKRQLTDGAERQNMSFETLALLTADAVPEDAAAVVLNLSLIHIYPVFHG